MAIVSKKFASDWAKKSCLSNQTNRSDFRVKKYGRSIIPASFRAVTITDRLRRINKIPLKVDKNLFFFRKLEEFLFWLAARFSAAQF